MILCASVITAMYVIASSMDLADELELDARRKEQAAQNIVLSVCKARVACNQGGVNWK